MIVIVDTNAYHRDVFANGQDFVTLFRWLEEATEQRELWTPRGVVEELVRQYDERRERIDKVIAVVKHDLAAFGLDRPKFLDTTPADADSYRGVLESRLVGPGRKIAAYPADVGKVVDWAAARRYPVTPVVPVVPRGEKDMSHFRPSRPVPITGVVDASIWLTVVEAAQSSTEVALVTANTKDFAAPAPKGQAKPSPPATLHPLLAEELQRAGVDPAIVSLFATVRDFNEANVPKPAQTMAEAFLRDSGTSAALAIDIEDAATWTPVDLDGDGDWGWTVEVDEATMSSFSVKKVVLDRAEPDEGGFFMTLEVYGIARLDLMIRKSEVHGLPDWGPISVYDGDWNEGMAAAEVEVDVLLLVEAHVRVGDEQSLSLSIEAVEPG